MFTSNVTKEFLSVKYDFASLTTPGKNVHATPLALPMLWNFSILCLLVGFNEQNLIITRALRPFL